MWSGWERQWGKSKTILLVSLSYIGGTRRQTKIIHKTNFGSTASIAKTVAAERFGPSPKVERDMLGSFVAHGLSQNEAESEILLQV